MGKCKDCSDWEADKSKSDELFLRDYHGQDVTDLGKCNSDSGKATASYDGGRNGELLTKGDFGCTEFKSKE